MSRSRVQERRGRKGQRAPLPLPTRFTSTGGASIVVTASVSDLCSLLGYVKWAGPKKHGILKGKI